MGVVDASGFGRDATEAGLIGAGLIGAGVVGAGHVVGKDHPLGSRQSAAQLSPRHKNGSSLYHDMV